jgi:hypothetical protein
VPVGDDPVDKLAAAIAVELPKGEGEVRVDVPEDGEDPMMGLGDLPLSAGAALSF